MYYSTCKLIFPINRDDLIYILEKAKDNLFDYIYKYDSSLFISKKEKIKILGVIPWKRDRYLTRSEASKLYHSMSFVDALNKLAGTKYKDIFLTYDLLLKFNTPPDKINIFVEDLKLLLDIGNITDKDVLRKRLHNAK